MSDHSKFCLILACGSCLSSGLAACDKKSLDPAPAAAPARPSALVAEPGPAMLPANSVHKLGETAQAPDFKVTLENVKECKVKYYFQPKKGNVKLGAEVVIEGTAERQIPVNPFYAKVTDADGDSYASTFAGCEPELKSSQVSKGQDARGWISFELPERASGLKLSYAPFVIGRGKQEVTFDLGR